jgi:[ribosomal protein S5]-alanine N-acetyltransferase
MSHEVVLTGTSTTDGSLAAEQPVLTTARLVLRPFEPADAPVVKRLAGAAEIADTTLNVPHPYGDGVAEEWIGTHAAAWRARRLATWAIVERASSALAGSIGLQLEFEHARAELGYWVGVPYWGRGFATEAAAAVVAFAFDGLRLNRVHAHHFGRNPASGRVLEKIGMKCEGTHRQSIRKGGRFEDIATYAMLALEWAQWRTKEGGGA